MRTATLSRLVFAIAVFVGSSCSTSTQSEEEEAEPATSRIEVAFRALEHENNADILRFFDVEADRDELVAACMQAAGFRYTSTPAPVLVVNTAEADQRFRRAAELDPGSREFRSEFGYGHSTLDALFYISTGRGEANQEYTASLSVSALDEYERRLFGGDYVEAVRSGSEGLAPGGCVGDAQAAIAFQYTSSDEVFGAFDEAFREARNRARSLGAYIAAEREWSGCVAGHGYQLGTPDDVFWFIEDKLAAINRFENAPSQVFTPGQDIPAELVEESGMALPEEYQNSSVFDADALAEVQEVEIQMALDLQGCDAAFDAATAPLLDGIATEVLAAYGLVLPT